MKEPHYNLYNDLVLSGLDHLISEVTRPESKSCLNQVYDNNPLRQQQMWCRRLLYLYPWAYQTTAPWLSSESKTAYKQKKSSQNYFLWKLLLVYI